MTLLDVARAAGVSKTVASRALGGYSHVAPATRKRILHQAQAQTQLQALLDQSNKS